MRTSFCALSRSATASLVVASRYSLAEVMRWTYLSFLVDSSLMRRCLRVFLGCLPLAMALVLPVVFLATPGVLVDLDPLNFLFFCLLARATLGIVDLLLYRKTDYQVLLHQSPSFRINQRESLLNMIINGSWMMLMQYEGVIV